MNALLHQFTQNRPFLENEFEEAVWDSTTGLSTEALAAELARRQASSKGLPTPLRTR